MKCYCIELVNGWSLRCCDVKLDKIRHDSYTMTFCQKHDSSSPLFLLCFFFHVEHERLLTNKDLSYTCFIQNILDDFLCSLLIQELLVLVLYKRFIKYIGWIRFVITTENPKYLWVVNRNVLWCIVDPWMIKFVKHLMNIYTTLICLEPNFYLVN